MTFIPPRFNSCTSGKGQKSPHWPNRVDCLQPYLLDVNSRDRARLSPCPACLPSALSLPWFHTIFFLPWSLSLSAPSPSFYHVLIHLFPLTFLLPTPHPASPPLFPAQLHLSALAQHTSRVSFSNQHCRSSRWDNADPQDPLVLPICLFSPAKTRLTLKRGFEMGRFLQSGFYRKCEQSGNISVSQPAEWHHSGQNIIPTLTPEVPPGTAHHSHDFPGPIDPFLRLCCYGGCLLGVKSSCH